MGNEIISTDAFGQNERIILRCGEQAIIISTQEKGGYYFFYIESTGETVRLHEWNIFKLVGSWTDAVGVFA